jgi:hypothetical protein
MMRKLYLVRCFYDNKILFALLILFIAAICYGHKTGLPVTPAFISNLYILKGDTRKDSFLFITVNGQTQLNLSHTFDEPRRMMIYSTLEAYHQGMLNGATDPMQAAIDQTVGKHPFLRGLRTAIGCRKSDYDRYLPWLLKYMQYSVSDSIKRLDIGMSFIHYDDRNLPVADSTKHLYQIE